MVAAKRRIEGSGPPGARARLAIFVRIAAINASVRVISSRRSLSISANCMGHVSHTV